MDIAQLLKSIRKKGIHIKLLEENLELVFQKENVEESVIQLVRNNKTKIVSYLKSISVEENTIEIPVAEVKDTYAITPSQFRFWLLCQMDDINKAYNMPLVLKIKGNLDIELLKRAFYELLKRHEILRSRFIQDNNAILRQEVLAVDAVVFDVSLTNLKKEENVQEKIDKLILQAFDLKEVPLCKAHLLKKNNKEHILCLNIHHIICDGISLEILLRDLKHIYDSLVSSRALTLPKLRIQFKDYAEWSVTQNKLKKEEAYWTNLFSDEIPVLDLPTYQMRPAVKTYNGSVHTHFFKNGITKNLKTFSNTHQGTPFMALMSAVNAILFRYTGQTDIVLGTAVSGRNNKDLENQIGLYINVLPIRTVFENASSFKELFELQKQVLNNAYSNATYSFGELVNILELRRDLSRTPLFDVLVTYQQQEQNSLSVSVTEKSALSFETMHHENTNSKYDLTFAFFQDGSNLGVALEYNTDLFKEDFIKSLARNYENLITQLLENPDLRIGQAEYIERAQLKQLDFFNNTSIDYQKKNTVCSLFDTQSGKTPHNIALVCQHESITYTQLQKKSKQLATHLRSIGVTKGDSVGICMGRSIEMVISMLGIMEAGAAYIPLDPFYPLDRIDFILEDSKTQFVIANHLTQGILFRESTIVNIEESKIWEIANKEISEPVESASMAYVIYTSGSTGKPKGVGVSHSNLLNFMCSMNQKFENKEEEDIWLAITSISFDISILELLWPLTRGNKVVIHLDRPIPIVPKPKMDFSLFYFPTGDSSESDKYKLLLEGARFADENDIKAIWVPERHFHSFGDQFPNPAIAAAAVATITKKIKLRSGSVVLPLHDAVRVAEEWSMIDNLSKGRVELSIASGWHPNDFVLAPGDFNNRHQIMRDKITVLKELWEGGSITRKNGIGKDFEFSIHPKPIQEKIPIWITAAGGIETFKYAGTIGANVLTHLMSHSVDELALKIKAYRQALQENGFDPEKGKVALMLHTFVSDDNNFAKETVEGPFKEYLRNSVNLLAPIAKEQGLELDNDIDKLLDMGFLRYYATGSLFGTPEKCLELINKLYNIDVNEIACLIDFGVNKDLVIENLKHLNQLKELIRRSRVQHNFISNRLNLLDNRESTASLIEEYGITHLQSTPSFYEELLMEKEGRQAITNIKTLLVGGEAFKKSLAEKMFKERRLPLYNMYGPTETTIWSSMKMIEDETQITIGTPIGNTQIYIMDASHALVPMGVIGELCIGGDGVSLGYLNNDALTAERFISDPFVPTQKVYKTGDLARWLPNGELEFLGRLDSQVKMNGYRIELQEIENVILEIPEVDQCAVTMNQQHNQSQLFAYVKSEKLKKRERIKEYLDLKLPNYMVPKNIIFLKEFWYTPNGKIDIKRLALAGKSSQIKKIHLKPKNKLEAKLVTIWSEFLKLDTLSVDDNFFEIGGNSMKAFQLLTIQNKALDLDLKIVSFFQFPTIRTLAASINQKEKATTLQLEENEMENVDDLIDFMTEL